MGGWSNTDKQRNIRRMDKYKEGDTMKCECLVEKKEVSDDE